jgi:hypothetical protein
VTHGPGEQDEDNVLGFVLRGDADTGDDFAGAQRSGHEIAGDPGAEDLEESPAGEVRAFEEQGAVVDGVAREEAFELLFVVHGRP